MSPIVIRYQLDPSGIDLNNRVDSEPHEMIRRQVRSVATSYGAFFAASLIVKDSATQNTLVQDVDYYAAELYEVPTARYGKKICAIIVITNANVSNNITITYQALGGDFSTSATAVIQMIENLSLDDRPVAWGSIIAKPSEYPPSHHLHDVGDVYGFEYVVHGIDRMREAIIMGDSASHDALYKYVDVLRAFITSQSAALITNLDDHYTNYNNPHKVTAAQLNVYLKAETSSLISSMGNNVNDALNIHKNNISNPHGVTASQLDVYLKSETNTLISALSSSGGNALNAHKGDTDNPHNVTASQLSVYLKSEIDTLLGTAATNSGAGLALKVDKTIFAPAGLAEIGRYLDFHGTTGVNDYDVRFDSGPTPVANGKGNLAITAASVSISEVLNVGAQTRLMAGSALVPSLTFTGEAALDTGLYWISDGVMGITSNGIKIGQFAPGGLTLTGDLSANSDIRLKENIKIIENALDKVDAINGVTFNKIADVDKIRKAGVIAQDIYSVLPEAVSIDEEGIMSVAYGNLVGLLIEAVKELRLEVNILKESKAKD